MKKTIIIFSLTVVLFSLFFSMKNKESDIKQSDEEKMSVFVPEPNDYVVDEVGVLSEESKNVIKSLIKNNWDKFQVGVIIVDSISPLAIEDYSMLVADRWRVGDKEKDNGVILVLAKKDRKVRIEVGYGLEYILNDAKVGRILDEDVLPMFKKGDYDSGIVNGVSKIINEINKYEN